MFHHTFYIHVGSLQCDFFHVSEAHGITNADYIFTSTEFLSSVSYFMFSKIMEITTLLHFSQHMVSPQGGNIDMFGNFDTSIGFFTFLTFIELLSSMNSSVYL